MEKISVIVPVYKVEQYLQRCIDSILAQTYANLEVILVDDGSPDNCGEICDNYTLKDNRVRVIHKENGGASTARNRGLDQATGTCILFVDSDDYIDSTLVEDLYQVMQNTQADIAECGCRYVKDNWVQERENTGKISVFTNMEALEMLYFGPQQYGGLTIMPWGKLYRSELLRNIRFPEGLMSEDCLFTPMALYQAKRVTKLNKSLYNFYHGPVSVTRGGYRLNMVDSIEIFKRLVRFYQDKGVERYQRVAWDKLISNYYYNYYECYLRRKDVIYRQKALEIRAELLTQNKVIIQYVDSKMGIFLHYVFRYCPNIWFLIMWIGKKVKKLCKR